jgi:hypothetical protein
MSYEVKTYLNKHPSVQNFYHIKELPYTKVSRQAKANGKKLTKVKSMNHLRASKSKDSRNIGIINQKDRPTGSQMNSIATEMKPPEFKKQTRDEVKEHILKAR